MVLCVAFVAALCVGYAINAKLREKARRTKCMCNLKQIGVGIHVYAKVNNDAFPPSLAELFPRYVMDGTLFGCPTAQNAVPIQESDLPTGAKDAAGVFTEANTDYVYVPGMTSRFPPDCVVAYGKPGNHGEGEGTNVLLQDGHAVWMKPAALDAALARTRKIIEARSK